MSEYLSKITKTLERIEAEESEKLSKVIRLVANTIKNDGLIFTFGCGHSHLPGLDAFYRAGGLANVSPMLDTDLMLHNGAAKSSKMEKMSGIAEPVFQRYCLTEKDCLFVISTSGKNAVPVEMAQIAVANGVKTVSVVSSAYFSDKKDAPMLYECSDLYIDNCVPHGDAVMDIDGCDTVMGSLSTVASAFIMQSVLLEAAELAMKQGKKPPIYRSGNVEGGAAFNKELIQQYIPRIKHL